MTENLLRLIAFDPEDLALVSAHMQDAILNLDTLYFDKKKQCVSALFHRFDWVQNARDNANIRHNCLIDIRHAQALRVRGLTAEHDTGTAPLNLLAITFEEAEAPSGKLTLYFSGNAALQIDVECLETTLADMEEAWQTRACPAHNVSEEN